MFKLIDKFLTEYWANRALISLVDFGSHNIDKLTEEEHKHLQKMLEIVRKYSTPKG